MALPTYFIARADRQTAAEPLKDVSASAHVIDVFRTFEEPDRYAEWMVTIDGAGHLHAYRAESRDTLPETLQSELAYQELISSNTRRTLRLREFHLIGARYLDQPAQAPGLNDPVHLYGTLYGPFRDVQDAEFESFEGQLTLTRADVLAAFVRGAPHAFRYPSPTGEGRAAPGCLHMMLPAAREDALNEGRGVALAYLLMPPDLMLSDAANELLAAQAIYELLSAVKQDLRKEITHHPLGSVTLPVPSRPVLERQLQAEGYTIEGNEAIRVSTTQKGFTGFLASVFRANEERLTLPEEGRLEEFLRLAHVTLASLPGWPSPRASALEAIANPQRPTYTSRIPIATAPASPEPTPAPQAPGPPKRPGPAWKPKPSSNAPEWMNDFESEPTTTKRTQSGKPPGPRKPGKDSEAAKPAADKRPEWMKDFE